MFSKQTWTGLIAAAAVSITIAAGQPAAASVARTYGFEHGFGG